ncbi:hypothetical protein KAU19_07455 [Candidatus Parcubacteria bacterium]|nr:hypothetical protein [Candidatus Parcubacteria bacterium]
MKITFTPLNKATDEIGGNKLVAVGGLRPATSLPRVDNLSNRVYPDRVTGATHI